MPTANVRYGRPKGSGRDDRQQLETIASLLAADPTLKPTTAIRSLGVEDPSAIRRLRDKLRVEQSKPTADVRCPGHANLRPVEAHTPCISSNENMPAADGLHPRATPLPGSEMPAARRDPAPANALLLGWFDLGFAALATAAETQAAVTQCWLGVPQVSMALRAQLALGAVGVAVHKRSKTRPLFLH